MAQTTPKVAYGNGLIFANSIDAIFQAILSKFSGVANPPLAQTVPYQSFVKEGSPPLLFMRNGANTAWIFQGRADRVGAGNAPLVGEVKHLDDLTLGSGNLYTDENGYLWLNGARGQTIGASGATSAAIKDSRVKPLWLKYWANTELTIQTAAGGGAVRTDAEADWAANKLLILPDNRGKKTVSPNTALSGYNAGQSGGALSKTIGINNLPAFASSTTLNEELEIWTRARDNTGNNTFIISSGGSPGNAIRISSQLKAIMNSPNTPLNVESPYYVLSRLVYTGYNVYQDSAPEV